LPTPGVDERGGPADQNCRRRAAAIWNKLAAPYSLTYPAPTLDFPGGEWAMLSPAGTSTRYLIQTSPAGASQYFWFPLPGLPANHKIEACELYLKGGSVHPTDSGDQPQVQLYEIDA